MLRQAADDTVHAADSRDNPYLVADTHLPVFAAIAHESTVLIGDIEHYFLGVVFIREQPRKVGLDIILVHPRTGLLVLAGMPDGEAIFDNILACLDVGNGYLMPCGDVFQYGDLLAVHFYNGTCRQGLYGYNHIVGRIDF